MLLASATLLTGCSIGGKEIVLDINTTNSHTVFSVDNMKCDKTEALIYLANYKNLYGTMYDVNLLETDDASNVEKYIRDVTVDELTRIYCMVSIAQQKKITLTDKEKSSVSKAAKEYYDSLNEAEKKFTKADLSDIESAYEHYAIAQKLYNSLSKGVDTEVSDEDATREIMGQLKAGQTIGVVVGPEGGFAPEEIALVDEHATMHRISLGRRILRTETAGLAALAMLVYNLDV